MKAPDHFALPACHGSLWVALSLAVTLPLALQPARASVTEAWVQRHSGMANHSNDHAVAVVCDGAGDFIVAGDSDEGVNGFDMLTIKYSSADGSVLWQRRYNNPAGGPNNDDHVKALAVDGHGDVIVTGSTYHWGLGDNCYTAKYAAADGALLWEQYYRAVNNDQPQAIAVDGGGNVIVFGTAFDGTIQAHNLIKYAAASGGIVWTKDLSDGALLWERRGGPRITALALDASGNAVVTGVHNAGFYTAKYAAADGAKLWGRHYGRESASGDSLMGSWDLLSPNPRGVGDSHSLALGPDGTIAIAGAMDGDSGPRGTYDYETILYREIPGPVSFAAWAADFGLAGTDAAPDADPDRDGLPNGVEYVLGGNPTSSATPAPPTATLSGDTMLFTFSRNDASESADVHLRA